VTAAPALGNPVHRRGRPLCLTAPLPSRLQLESLIEIGDWLEAYRRLWERRFDRIEEVLDQMKAGKLDDGSPPVVGIQS
jgi:hypothetical protein